MSQTKGFHKTANVSKSLSCPCPLYAYSIKSSTPGNITEEKESELEEFIVLNGSRISDKLTKSYPTPTLRNREKYASKVDKNFMLKEDILFTSPSAAASYIGGASLSGNATWHNAQGITLKNHRRKIIG